MIDSMAARSPLPFILLLFSLVLYNYSALLWEFAGRVEIDKSRLVQWQNSAPINNENCKVIHEANGCEDVKIHFASQIAFLACGDPLERTHWYPPSCIRTVARRSESSFREQLFKYDLRTGRTTELQIKGLEGDFVNHGIEIFQLPEDSSKVFNSRHSRRLAD